MGNNGFKIETVKRCPVVKASCGVITMAPGLINQIAGAVRDKVEWIVLMNGTRSDDGYEVNVQRFTVPPQYRNWGHAEMAELELAADVVGVMHSHHSMGAFFSGTDDKHLNPRFASSIVVAISRNNLGFEYKACGKVILPCGAVGEEVPFRLQVAGVERFAEEVVRATHEGTVPSLGDCSNYTDTDGEYTYVEQASCGLSAVVDAPLIFGMDQGEGLLEIVRKQTIARGYPSANNNHSNNTYKGLLTDGKSQKGNKKNGRGKYSARRNGLVRLERPTSEKDVISSLFYDRANGRNTFIWQMCESCRAEGLTKKHQEFDSFLCTDCWEEAELIIEESLKVSSRDESALNRVGSLLVNGLTDDLDGTELGTGSEDSYYRVTD